MKKIAVLLVGVAMCLQGMAQSSKVTSAKMHMDEFVKNQDSTELYSAKGAIDEASANDKTKDEPKMYLYRGEVYLTLFNTRINNIVTGLIKSGGAKNKATGMAYDMIDTTMICVAANSFIRVLQINSKDFYADEAREPQNIPTCDVFLENKAIHEMNQKHYASALALFQKLQAMYTVRNISDSSYKDAVRLSATAADRGENYPVAMNYYQKLIDLKYGDALPYTAISAIYLKQKDSAKAWDYLEKGRAQYPNDLQMIITETNFYIVKHNYEKAEGNLMLAIDKLQKSPDKDKNKGLLSSLYFNLAQIYDHKMNPKDAAGNDLPKPADYADLVAQADTNYHKALLYTPDNFDVLFATGALYYNQAVPITKAANELPLNAKEKYDKLMDQAKAYFLKAQPFFEKAHDINPGDVANTNALTEVYANTGQNDKIEALKNKK